MRHRKKVVKLGRSAEHRKAMLAALVCGLIKSRRIKTTLQEAKQARMLAERMITLGKQGTLAARRFAIQKLMKIDEVAMLFKDIAPQFSGRQGGYTRIIKIGKRASDGAEMAFLEWTGIAIPDRKKKPQKVAQAETKK